MRRFSRRSFIRLAIASILFGAMAILAVIGATNDTENRLRGLAFALTEHAASGQLHIIEMDAASVAAIDQWPWPRGHYANLVDQLQQAGVRSITFDVDFSSPSAAADDAQLALALERAGGIVALPTFAQAASHGASNQIDALPIDELRRHVSLASVSVMPDADGLVRRMPLGTLTDGTPRPSLSAHISGRSGSAGDVFPVDFSIDPASIPRHSFVAIERGHFDPQTLRGKDIIIGATAVELGDRHVVPRHGVLPGVVVQALAAETLFTSLPMDGGWLPLLAIGSLLSIWIISAAAIDLTVLRGSISLGLTCLLTWAAWNLGDVALEVVPGAWAIIAAVCARMLRIKRKQARIRQLTDIGSGLPNQSALTNEIAKQNGGYIVAAMIDKFDALKSILGEEDIDQFVSRLAERLRAASGGQTIYRIDHRVLAWISHEQAHVLENALAGLQALMHSPMEVDGKRLDVSLGLGIAEDGMAADASHMAQLSLLHGERWRYQQASEHADLEGQLRLMSELDQAVAEGELEVHYQPKLDIASSRVAAVEALVRWQHNELGYLSPDNFILQAEKSGRISRLTLYVLEKTIADLLEWNRQGLKLSAAVNISARLVASHSFNAAVGNILAKHSELASQLIFEITESASLDDAEAAIAALHKLRDLGISISMDDYGTGQSSLNYLQKLPLSELKIDRQFVQFAYCQRNDGLLVRSTVNLAHQMGLKVVAEGVEDAECLSFLRKIGCDQAQGYFVSRPLKAEQLAQFAMSEFSWDDALSDASAKDSSDIDQQAA